MSTLKTDTLPPQVKDEKWLAKADSLYKEHQENIMQSLETSHSVRKKIIMAGFTVDIVDETATKSLSKKIASEAEKLERLKKKCKDAGIAPIAILPNDVSNKIFMKAGFYTFYRMQPDGRVYGNGKKLLRKNILNGGYGLAIVGICFLLGLVGLIFSPISHITWSIIVGSLFVFSLVYILIRRPFRITGEDEENKNSEAEVSLTISIAMALSPVFLLLMVFASEVEKLPIRDPKKALWPQKNDTEEVTEDLFTLKLPEPPLQTLEILRKCHANGIEVFLSVHPNAFDVVIGNKTMRDLRSKYDPVICTRENGMVAILDQFGDFPEEKEVITYIAEHFDALRRDLLPLQIN